MVLIYFYVCHYLLAYKALEDWFHVLTIFISLVSNRMYVVDAQQSLIV